MKRFVSAIILLSSLHSFSQQQGNAFSLQQAVEYAVKNSPGHQNTELDQQSAIHRKKEITGLGLPQVNASVDIKNYIEIPTSLIPAAAFNPFAGPDDFLAVQFGTKYNGTAGVSASQLLFSSDYIFGLKASREFIKLSRINTLRSKAELAAQVSKAYYNVLINHDRIRLLEANITRLTRIFNDTKAIQQQGFAEQIDVERLEVQLNNLLSEKEKIDKLIGLSETLLKFQMGYKLSDPIALSDSLRAATEEFTALSANGLNYSERPEIKLLQSQQSLYDLDVKRLKWGYLPTLVAYGAYQYNTQRQKADFLTFDKNNPLQQWYEIALIGVTLNLNIFDGFQRHHKIQQAKITSLKNQNTLKSLTQAAELEATVAAISYNNAYTSLQIQKKNMELALHVYDVAQKKYKGGVGSNLEIVNAEAALKEAQTNYYNAVFDMLVAKIDFQKASGTLIKN